MITVIDYEPIQVFEGDGIDRGLPPKTFFLFDYPISVEDESAIVLDADSLAVNYKTTLSFDYFMKA